MERYTDDFLAKQRLICDTPADDFINETFGDADKKAALYNLLAKLTDNVKLDTLPAEVQVQLFANAKTLPVWADKKQMQAGAEFFARYAELVMNLLGLLSLPYCYAGANGAMVLYLSEKIRNDIQHRLLDTAGFVWDVMAPNAFGPEGKGFASILKVRLNHAAARYYTLKSGKWNTEWGMPVNQEDLAGTNLSFSLMVIRGLRKMGITITETEQQGFLQLWNVIGFLLGVNDAMLPQNGKQAFNLEQAIRQRQFRSSEQGIALTKSLTDYFKTFTTDSPVTHQEMLQLMRYLLGDEIADLLALPPATMSSTSLNFLQISNTFRYIKPAQNTTQAYLAGHSKFKKLVK